MSNKKWKKIQQIIMIKKFYSEIYSHMNSIKMESGVCRQGIANPSVSRGDA